MNITIKNKEGITLKTANKYCEEDINIAVKGEENLLPENIKKDIEILGITGTFEGGNTYNAVLGSREELGLTSTSFSIGKTLKEIKHLDLAGYTSLSGMFSSYENLELIGSLSNTNKATNWSSSFYNTKKLKKVPTIDTSSATNMQTMFQYSGIEEFEQEELFVEKVTSSCMSMFNGCSNLKKLPKMNFLKATVFNSFCGDCKNLEFVKDIYAPLATNWNQAFYSCSKLQSVEGMDFSNCTMINMLFYNCRALKHVQAIQAGKMNVLRDGVFTACGALEEFGGMIDLGKAYTQKTANYNDYIFSLSESPLLTHESLMNVINKLYDLNLTYNVTGGGTLYTQSLKLGSTNLAKLTTAEEIAIATAKGWTVS